MNRHKLLLDCDPGVDDAIALYFALAHPQFELLTLTTTFGNATVAQTTRNALDLCALAGRRISVCAGMGTPLRKLPRHPDLDLNGADGLGNLPQRPLATWGPSEQSAARAIVELAHAHPQELVVVVTGPLSNLAHALRLEPKLPALLKQVLVMGGTICEPGNASPVAEFNVWHDPHAADLVLTAGLPLTLVPLDVTQRVQFPLAQFERIANQQRHPACDALLHAVRFQVGYLNRIEPELAAYAAGYGHDVVALLYLAQPNLFDTRVGRVRVATEGLAEGQTIMDRREHYPYPQAGWEDSLPAIQVCQQVDAAACLALYESVLLGPWLSSAKT